MLYGLDIVIPCLEEVDRLRTCLRSIAARLPGQSVVIVQMAEWRSDPGFDENLRIRRVHASRLPAGAARNLGARSTSSEYVFFLDSDCWLIGENAVWERDLAWALGQKPELVVLQRSEEGRGFLPKRPSRWNFSRHCIEWNLIWSRDHFLRVGALDELCCTGSSTMAQAGEAFSICFKHFDLPGPRTIYLPSLHVGHPSLIQPKAPPWREFEYAYGSSYVAMRQLRDRPSLLALFWFFRTLAGFGKDMADGLPFRQWERVRSLLRARLLAAWDALRGSGPRPRNRAAMP